MPTNTYQYVIFVDRQNARATICATVTCNYTSNGKTYINVLVVGSSSIAWSTSQKVLDGAGSRFAGCGCATGVPRDED